MKKISFLFLLGFIYLNATAQGDNEIQVYASQTIGNKKTIFELHSNYTFAGSKKLVNPKSARWLNETLEITTGFGDNFELGFYTFSAVNPFGGYEYLGNQIRPRITVPEKWKWAVGASLSAEFGFYRPDAVSDFFWQGEIRPIIDKTVQNWYFSFNPNIDFVVSGDNKGAGFSPQFKTVYSIQQKYGIGIEYYSGWGDFRKILPLNQQEHHIGPMFDLYVDPKWELNVGMLFGLTDYSNQQIFKLLVGRRFGK